MKLGYKINFVSKQMPTQLLSIFENQLVVYESLKIQPLTKPIAYKSYLYSAANFCFNKGLCMIWNKVTLSKHTLH